MPVDPSQNRLSFFLMGLVIWIQTVLDGWTTVFQVVSLHRFVMCFGFRSYPSTAFPDSLFFAVRDHLWDDSRDIKHLPAFSGWLFIGIVGIYWVIPRFLADVTLEDLRCGGNRKLESVRNPSLGPDNEPWFYIYFSHRAVKQARRKAFCAAYKARVQRRRQLRGPVCYMADDNQMESRQRATDWTKFDVSRWQTAVDQARDHVLLLRPSFPDSPDSLYSRLSVPLLTPLSDDTRHLRPPSLKKYLWRKTKAALIKHLG